jgi:ATP-dependent DNA helicase RecQ
MMRYAQSTECRVQKLREYFGEEAGRPCGRCDNCKEPLAARKPRTAPQPARAIAKPPTRPRFHDGDEVRHRRYGRGKVLEVSGENVLVAFARARRSSGQDGRRAGAPLHRIKEDWLSPA